MPYVTTMSYYPAVGKGWDVLDAMRARVKDLQSKGSLAALQVKVVTGSGQVHQVVQLNSSLADWQAERKRNLADPGTKAFVQKIAPMVSGPASMEVFEVLVPFTTPPVTGDFLFRPTHYPLPGKAVDLAASGMELTKRHQKEFGLNAQFISQSFSDDGSVIQGVYVFKDMAGWETALKAIRADPESAAWLRTVASLSRRHANVSVWEVLIDIPAK